MEDGFGESEITTEIDIDFVLILILMEDGFGEQNL